MKEIKFEISSDVELPNNVKNKILLSLTNQYKFHKDNIYEEDINETSASAFINNKIEKIKIIIQKTDYVCHIKWIINP